MILCYELLEPNMIVAGIARRLPSAVQMCTSDVDDGWVLTLLGTWLDIEDELLRHFSMCRSGMVRCGFR
ncbi:hypothetical protein EON65_01520 [archaeon]|nr:MAG: hypothetical protein EON65_01520 [archaeon]